MLDLYVQGVVGSEECSLRQMQGKAAQQNGKGTVDKYVIKKQLLDHILVKLFEAWGVHPKIAEKNQKDLCGCC